MGANVEQRDFPRTVIDWLTAIFTAQHERDREDAELIARLDANRSRLFRDRGARAGYQPIRRS